MTTKAGWHINSDWTGRELPIQDGFGGPDGGSVVVIEDRGLDVFCRGTMDNEPWEGTIPKTALEPNPDKDES